MRSHDKNKSSALNRTRSIWLKNPQNLTDSQRRKLSELAGMAHLYTVKAYDFRLRLQQFYDTHKAYTEEMVCDFKHLALDMCNSSVREISKVDESLTRNAQEIHNYFSTFRTNAILEGFNSKVANIEIRARDSRNMNNFINMTYFVCGEFSLPFQPIM